MIIPNKIKLLDAIYKVQLVDCLSSSTGGFRYGECDYSHKTIKIRTKFDDGRLIPIKEQYITLWHEIVHIILGEGCYHDETNNEALVEWCAKNLSKIVAKL